MGEDSEAMRRMLVGTLAQQGFEVMEAKSGSRLLALVEQARHEGRCPSIIISDINMPGATGFDVLKTAKRHLPSVPVILITAFGDAHTHERAASLGAFSVVDKPFDMSDLKRRIEAACGDSPTRRG